MVTLQVQAKDPTVEAGRTATAKLVLDYFQFNVPGSHLLCFLDDIDFAELKSGKMKGNRGVFVASLSSSIRANYPPLPYYVKDMYGLSHYIGRRYGSLIYIHGSTCEPRESLVITLAHELGHFTQSSQHRGLYEADRILECYRGYRPDLPSESDAFLVSKRIATELCGEELIRDYAESQIEIAEDRDRPRWEYFLSLSLDDPLSFAEKTRLQCQEHQTPLNIMIRRDAAKYKRSFPRFDFDKSDWWEE
jgi:hypothetical protein